MPKTDAVTTSDAVTVKVRHMTKRLAKALPLQYEVRTPELMLLRFEGWTYARDLEAGASHRYAVLCAVPVHNDCPLWIVGSFMWLKREGFETQRTVRLAGHHQEGAVLTFVPLT